MLRGYRGEGGDIQHERTTTGNEPTGRHAQEAERAIRQFAIYASGVENLKLLNKQDSAAEKAKLESMKAEEESYVKSTLEDDGFVALYSSSNGASNEAHDATPAKDQKRRKSASQARGMMAVLGSEGGGFISPNDKRAGTVLSTGDQEFMEKMKATAQEQNDQLIAGIAAAFGRAPSAPAPPVAQAPERSPELSGAAQVFASELRHLGLTNVKVYINCALVYAFHEIYFVSRNLFFST